MSPSRCSARRISAPPRGRWSPTTSPGMRRATTTPRPERTRPTDTVSAPLISPANPCGSPRTGSIPHPRHPKASRSPARGLPSSPHGSRAAAGLTPTRCSTARMAARGPRGRRPQLFRSRAPPQLLAHGRRESAPSPVRWPPRGRRVAVLSPRPRHPRYAPPRECPTPSRP